MKNIIWEIEYLSFPAVYRHCQKCGSKTEFICSGCFRVNAQRKSLDIWLIYRCADCSKTWNAAVCSRITPQSLSPGLLERFHVNDDDLIRQYAMDTDFLRRNGAETGLPAYSVTGETFSANASVVLEIKSPFPLPIKISSLLREKLGLSRTEYRKLTENGRIQAKPACDMQKCRLNTGILLFFNL